MIGGFPQVSYLDRRTDCIAPVASLVLVFLSEMFNHMSIVP